MNTRSSLYFVHYTGLNKKKESAERGDQPKRCRTEIRTVTEKKTALRTARRILTDATLPFRSRRVSTATKVAKTLGDSPSSPKLSTNIANRRFKPDEELKGKRGKEAQTQRPKQNSQQNE